MVANARIFPRYVRINTTSIMELQYGIVSAKRDLQYNAYIIKFPVHEKKCNACVEMYG